DLEAVEAETVQRKTFTIRFNLGATPVHGAPLSCVLAITNVAAIAGVLDRWRVAQFGWPEFAFDSPARDSVRRRIEEPTLLQCDRAIEGPLAQAGNATERVLGGRAKSGAISR